MKKKVFSLLLALVMLFSMIPSALAEGTESADQVHVIVENTTYAKNDGAPWDGTLVDKWVKITEESTAMSCIVDALGSYHQTGAEDNYISEINGLAAFDGGQESGWMGTLNDWFTNEGFSAFTVKNGKLQSGDEIRLMYTTNGYGADLGGTWTNADKTLKALGVSAGTLTPAFDKATHEYTLSLTDETAVIVTPTAANKNYQVHTYVGAVEYKRTAEIPVENGTVINVKCGDPNWPSMNGDAGEAQVYTFTVEKPTPSGVINVNANGVKSITITGAEVDSATVDGTTINVALASGTADGTEVKATFAATDATSVKFGSKVVKAPNVNLVRPIFAGIQSVSEYETTLTQGEGSLTVYCYNTPASILPQGDGGTKYTVNFTVKPEGFLSEIAFGTAMAAPNRGTCKLTPAFKQDTHEYTVYVGDNLASIYAWATLSDLGEGNTINCTYKATNNQEKTIKVTSAKTTGASLTTAIAKGSKGNDLTFVVGEQEYIVHVKRVATLSSLALTNGEDTVAVGPTFAAGTTEYSVIVPKTAKLKAVASAAEGAVITVNGKAATDEIELNWENDESEVVVTVSYGTDESKNEYKIAVLANTLKGEGTEENPYLIESLKDMEKFRDYVNSGNGFEGAYFKLTTDVTLPADWTPIGDLTAAAKATYSDYNNVALKNSTPFMGTFDGDGHTITVAEGGLTAFGSVSYATLKNFNVYGKKIAGYGVVQYWLNSNPNQVTIENVKLLSGSRTMMSGFIGGYASGQGRIIIRNCVVEKGVIVGNDRSGYWDGFDKKDALPATAYAYGPTAPLYQNDFVGSFIGAGSGEIENCTSGATVVGNNYVGGIWGFKGQSMGDCIARNCAFTGEVNAAGKFVGGILGGGYSATSAPNTPGATVESCVCTGSVKGANYVGGIFGGEELQKQSWNNGIGYIRGNYFAGTVTATAEDGVKGGIIGYMDSLDCYNVICGNYYLAGTANAGIGAVNEANIEKTNAQYMRVDDPLGADAAKLTDQFTAAELTNGALVRKLNSATIGSAWTQGENAPVLNTAKHVVRLTCASLNSMSAGAVKQAEGYSTVFGKDVTVTYSDGTTEMIKVSDCAVSGLDLTKLGYEVCTLSYQGYSLTFGVNIQEGGTAPSASDTITVTVSVLGDTIHDVTADQYHILAAGNLTAWMDSVIVTVGKDATVLDAVEKACEAYGIDVTAVDSYYGGKYVSAITSVEGVQLTDSSNKEANGYSYCGWQYAVNGVSPWTTIDATALADKDVVCLYFEDDYSMAYVQSAVDAMAQLDADFAGFDCAKLKAAEDSIRWLSPLALEKVTNRTLLTDALLHLNEMQHTGEWTVTKPATDMQCGEKELICTVCGHTITASIPAVITEVASGVYMKLDAFPQGTTVVAEEKTSGRAFETAKNALENIAVDGKIVVFDFSAFDVNNAPVQPNGKVMVSFVLPDGLKSENLALYYISDDGKIEKIPVTVENGMVAAELSHFSTYALCNETPAKSDVPATGDSSNCMLWLGVMLVSACAVTVMKRKKEEI